LLLAGSSLRFGVEWCFHPSRTIVCEYGRTNGRPQSSRCDNSPAQTSALETRRVQSLTNARPLGQLVHALPVSLCLLVEQRVLVARQHLRLGRHLDLPALNQLGRAQRPAHSAQRLVARHVQDGVVVARQSCGGFDELRHHLALARSAAMAARFLRGVCGAVEDALALGCGGEFGGGGFACGSVGLVWEGGVREFRGAVGSLAEARLRAVSRTLTMLSTRRMRRRWRSFWGGESRHGIFLEDEGSVDLRC
jgi:hypothetical protein